MAGRHVALTSASTFAIAVGLKGLLRRRRPSFVVCALRSFAASARTGRGGGGFWGSVGGGGGGPVVVGERRER